MKILKTFQKINLGELLSKVRLTITTETRHKNTVQHLWNELEKNDDIYLSNYSGWYSVSDEAFYNH